MAEDNSSVTYLVTGLPKIKSVSQFRQYFGLKRNCGGAGEIADCEPVTDNSIVLTYEKTAGYLCIIIASVLIGIMDRYLWTGGIAIGFFLGREKSSQLN